MADATDIAEEAPALVTRKTISPSRRGSGLAWLLHPRLTIGLTILTVMGLGSFILPIFAPVDPSIQGSYARNLPASFEHLLGTNALGQDIFWFLVYAIRNSLTLGLVVAIGVTLIATTVGLSAGYIGGRFERFVMLIVDTIITIPLLPVLIILGALIRGNTSFMAVGFIIILFGWAWDARTVRSMALSLREREFINTARFSGANTAEIIIHEIFPYVTAYILVGFINVILFAINTEAALAVIGLSRIDVPTLGSIIFWALNYNALFTGHYLWLIAPILAAVTLFIGLFLTSTGFNAAFATKRGVQ
jgi:peptide/nickel transport system permease protein